MQTQGTRKPQTPPLTRGKYAVQPPVRRVIPSIDWLRVVSAAAEARAETLRAALEEVVISGVYNVKRQTERQRPAA